MAVKIRLARRGRKKLATYDVIVADARSPRDGRIIEKLGTYNPLTNPATIVINDDKTLDWLLKGAQPTDTARRILSVRGILLKKHLQVGVLKEAITQEQADAKFADWQKTKEAELSGTLDSLAKIKADEAKARLDAEKKINEAKAEALKKKLAALVPVEEAPAEEEVAVAEEAKEQTKEEAIPTEEPKVEASDKKAEPAPVEEKVEEVKTEATEKPKAEAPTEEKVETPVKEEKAVDAKVEETKKEAKVEEAKADKVEAPVAKKEAKAEEKKEEDKK